jgi:adenosine deaminase
VLLDSVRHWGPAVAHRVLDLHDGTPWGRVAGFGLGGDETSIPAAEFRGVYERVRARGLAPLVHAGEWGGPDSVAEALEHLRPVRIAHGIRAADDPALLRRLVRRGVALDVCLTSNTATGALRRGEVHPVRRLLAAGVTVTLSTDDPGLFGTSLLAEYRGLARLGASGRDLRAVAAASLSAALHRPERTRS